MHVAKYLKELRKLLLVGRTPRKMKINAKIVVLYLQKILGSF